MELWIRSQNKIRLLKVNDLYLKDNYVYVKIDDDTYKGVCVGEYSSNERALEILDEISSKIKNHYIVEIKPLLSKKEIERIEFTLNYKYNENFIMQPPETTITPINSNVIYYEMPKE